MNNRILYFDCLSGICGEKTIGALLDLGIDKDVFLNQIKKLPIKDYTVHISKEKNNGIMCTVVEINIDEHIKQLNVVEINKIIDESHLNKNTKLISKNILKNIANAKAKVHGKKMNEVKVIDCIIHIVGTAICIDMLDINKIICSPLHIGTGFTNTKEGMIPVPVPATLEIIKNSGIPTYASGIKGQLITPIGASIIATLVDKFESIDGLVIKNVGYGASKEELQIPNILRVVIGEIPEQKDVTVIETNIDDMSGELAGYLMDKLLEKGALDVFYTPIQMKKNRPALKLTVISKKDEVKKYERMIISETTTIGLRKYNVKRTVMNRKKEKIKTKYGEIGIKICEWNDIKKVTPEYEDCKKIAKQYGIPLRVIYEDITSQKLKSV